jgi:alpha-glucosidase
LPGGTWHEFGGKTVYAGGREVVLDAPLETIPVLVRAGAVLLLEENGSRTLSLYPAQDGVSSFGVVYDEEGDGNGGVVPGDFHRLELISQ